MEFYADATKDAVKLRATTLLANAATIEITRTMNGESKRVRAATSFVPGTPMLWAAIDVEILFQTPITYSAIVRDAAGVLIESDTAGPVTVVNNSAYLRDVLLPSHKMAIRLVGADAGNQQSEVRRELLRPLGRAAPVVITDVRAASTGSTSILTMTNAEQKQLRGMLGSGRVLMFTGPSSWDITWPLFLHFGTVTVSRVGSVLSEHRLWGLAWDEVDSPPVGLYDPVPPRIWQSIVDAGDQWADLYMGTWLDVIYPIETTLMRAA